MAGLACVTPAMPSAKKLTGFSGRPDALTNGQLDFSDVAAADAYAARAAVAGGENFFGYLPSVGFDFIVRNFRALAALGALEAAWLDAYVHVSHFGGVKVDTLRAIFDARNRDRLLALKPHGDAITFARNGRITLFRGCAGPTHTMGMSWTPSLDKAIWYAAHHAAYYDLTNVAAYAGHAAPARDQITTFRDGNVDGRFLQNLSYTSRNRYGSDAPYI